MLRRDLYFKSSKLTRLNLREQFMVKLAKGLTKPGRPQLFSQNKEEEDRLDICQIKFINMTSLSINKLLC